MTQTPPIHPDLQYYLEMKDPDLIKLYEALRTKIWELCPNVNELCYHTHALTSVFTLSEKLGDGFCHIPIYTNHLNLGFNLGALLRDPNNLLQGTGKKIRHIPIKSIDQVSDPQVEEMILAAFAKSEMGMDKEPKETGTVISKIKGLRL